MKTKTVFARQLHGCLFGSALLWALPAFGQTSLLSGSDPSALAFSGGTYATGRIVNVTGAPAPFSEAWDITVATQPPQSNSVTLKATTCQAVAKGDLLVATFYYRSTGWIGNELNVTAAFEDVGGTQRSVSLPLRGRQEWRSMAVPFLAAASYPSSGAQFAFELGQLPQEVQIGGVQLLDYGQRSVLTNSSNVVDCTGQFNLSNQGGPWGTVSTISVSGNPFFTTAARITTAVSPGISNGWELRFQGNLAKAVAAGDTLVAIFWLARDSGSNQANMGVSGYKFQEAPSPYTNIASQASLMVDGSWKRYAIPFTCPGSYPANGTQFQLWFGAAVQTLDVGGIQIVDLGSTVAPSTLTDNESDYPGRSLNDPWQAAAWARIKQYRMGNLSVKVSGPSGSISGVNVGAVMQKHRFGFSSVVNWKYFLNNASDPDDLNYQAAMTSSGLFSKIEMGNYKWPWWEQNTPTQGPGLFNQMQQWLRAHGVTEIRGHNLIWPNYETDTNGNYSLVPADVPALNGSALVQRVLDHIDDEVSDPTVKSFINDWDVVNEPYLSRNIQNNINGVQTGTAAQDASVIATWFNETKVNDPMPHRFVNEAHLESNALHLDLAAENYDYNLLSALISDGAAVDGIGFESHFTTLCTPPVTAKQIFDRFATLAPPGSAPLKEQVTEFDTQIDDPIMLADYVSDYMTLVFSEPDFDAFSIWGFWAGDFPDSIVYNTDWSLKPAGMAYTGLVRNKWWTNGTAVTNSSGIATINGFLGRYALTATSLGMTKTYYADLPTTAGATVFLELNGTPGTFHVWLYEPENVAAIYAPLLKGTDPNALNGGYVATPPSLNATTTPSSPQMRLDVEANGTVNIWVRVIAPGNGSNSLWVQIDDGPWQVLTMPVGTAWHWYKWTQTTLSSYTSHVINLAGRAGGTKLDQVLVTDDLNFVP